jgi:hypothetical protein
VVTSEISVVHANEQPDVSEWAASIFLAGPMPRDASVPSWRPAMLEAIEHAWRGPGTLVVFVPEPRDWKPFRYDHHRWEDRWLSVVDVIVFWVPRDMDRLPGMNTNIEFGRWENSGRFVFGAPPSAVSVGYLRECAARKGAPVAGSVERTVAEALNMIGGGRPRADGHRDVPLLLWCCPRFQDWLHVQAGCGKKLLGGRLLWVYEIDPHGCPQYWAFQAHFEDSRGTRTTEVVLSNSGPRERS